MSECLICYEKFNKSSRKEISCFSCDKKFCRKCIQMYLTSIKEIPTCPECNTEWTLEYISTITPKSYHNLEYRKHRTSIVLDREKGLLVETQPQVEIIMQERKNAEELEKLRMERFTIVSAPKKDFSEDEIVKKLEEKIQKYNNKLQDRLHELDTIENSRLYIVENRIKELENIMRFGIKKEERKQFIKACPMDDCRGFLSTAWKCGLCETWICKDCHEKKAEKDDESHTCNPDSVETAKLIAAETKPCPTCAIPIYKINGCDQMYCCAEDTLIWMWDGSKKQGKEVKEGDVLIGEDGNQVIVEHMTRGENTLYEIRQQYADNYKVIGKHLLTLKDENNNTVDISAEDFYKLPRYKQKKYFRYKCQSIEWPSVNVDLDPYILGIWLGDPTSNRDKFESDDIEVIKSWYNWCVLNNCEIIHIKGNRYNISSFNESKNIPVGSNNMSECVGCSKKPSLLCASSVELQELMNIENIDERIKYKNLSKLSSVQKTLLNTTNEYLLELYNWKISAEKLYKNIDRNKKVKNQKSNNKFTDLLTQYNLIENKHIPQEYLVNDKNIRLKLLAGLMDTDGKIHQKSYIFIRSERKMQLFNNIVDLSRSLGFSTSITSYHTREVDLFAEEKNSTVMTKHYMMKIIGNISEIKVNINRKKYILEEKYNLRSTIDVQIADVGKYVGWSVIGKTPRFLLGDGTVTHNCTVCHTAFSWTTGKKETGVIHNPHYYEWQRQQNNGVVPRAEGDIVCGGLPDILVLDRHLLDKKIGCTVISQKVINDRHRIVNHVLHVDIPNYNVGMGDAFQQLRIRYLLQTITEQEWISYIQRNEKKNEKNHAIIQVLRMFTTVMSDMFNNILTKDYDDIIIIWEDMEKLRKYTNDNLLKIYIRFNNVTPYITQNWESVSITSKDKDRDIAPNIWTHIYEIPTAVSNTIRLETDGDNNIIVGTKIIKEGGFCYPNLMAPDFTSENIIEIKYITFRITPSNKKTIKRIKDGKYEIQIFTKVDDNLGVGVIRENRDEFCIGDRVLNNAHKKTGNILSISSDKNMCKVVYDDSRVDNLHKSVLTFSPSYAPNLDAFIVEDIIPFDIFREIKDENMYDVNTYTFEVPIVLKPGNIMSIVNKSGALDFTWCGDWTVFDPIKFRYLYAFNYGEKVGDIIHRIQTTDQLKPGFYFGININ
jgi:hypothetical protein